MAGCIGKVASISPRKVVSEYPQVQILALAGKQSFVEVTRFDPFLGTFRSDGGLLLVRAPISTELSESGVGIAEQGGIWL
jgi:hypothetical protein